jgi:hypothetical protein
VPGLVLGVLMLGLLRLSFECRGIAAIANRGHKLTDFVERKFFKWQRSQFPLDHHFRGSAHCRSDRTQRSPRLIDDLRLRRLEY